MRLTGGALPGIGGGQRQSSHLLGLGGPKAKQAEAAFGEDIHRALVQPFGVPLVQPEQPDPPATALSATSGSAALNWAAAWPA